MAKLNRHQKKGSSAVMRSCEASRARATPSEIGASSQHCERCAPGHRAAPRQRRAAKQGGVYEDILVNNGCTCTRKCSSSRWTRSRRSPLASALHAAGVDDAMIQLICRWMCPESLHVYRRMGVARDGAVVHATPLVIPPGAQPTLSWADAYAPGRPAGMRPGPAARPRSAHPTEPMIG